MNILIVYAHPEPTSFNGAMRDLAVKTLNGAGRSVEMSDLYAMEFNPVTGAHDFTGTRSGPTRLSIPREQTHAMETRAIATDIAAEQEKLANANMVKFPVWWFGMPAILKGWADRVFARSFAYLSDRTQHLFFHSAKDYDPDERLRPGVAARSGAQRNV